MAAGAGDQYSGDCDLVIVVAGDCDCESLTIATSQSQHCDVPLHGTMNL